MKRLLVVPAAGQGSRLGWAGPKALCPVAGAPMIRWLFNLYAPLVDAFVVVVSPAARPAFEETFAADGLDARIVVQERPTGMLPAILCAAPPVREMRPDEVWITWCDQIGISPGTIATVSEMVTRHPDAALVFPTVQQRDPYIHFERDEAGRLLHVRHRRENDAMPPVGESDAGLFVLRLATFLSDLPSYSDLAPVNAAGEANFLPFLPWLAGRRTVLTSELEDPREAIGINTPADLAVVERYVRDRGLRPRR